MSKSRRVVLLVILLAAMSLGWGSSAWATTTPGVNATPGNWTTHGWTSDGCTAVPDTGTYRGVYYDFGHACAHHDGCYSRHWASRATCDDWFYNDMVASCNYLHSSSSARLICYERAGIYWQGVRWFGGPGYNGWSYYIPILG